MRLAALLLFLAGCSPAAQQAEAKVAVIAIDLASAACKRIENDLSGPGWLVFACEVETSEAPGIVQRLELRIRDLAYDGGAP
jgi:hypothetical protein